MEQPGQVRLTTSNDYLLSKCQDNNEMFEIDEMIVNGDNKYIWLKNVIVFWSGRNNGSGSFHLYFNKDNSIIKKNKDELLKEVL